MDYTKWAEEYISEGEKIKRNIQVLQSKYEISDFFTRDKLHRDIIILQSIYYELMLTARHLMRRGQANA